MDGKHMSKIYYHTEAQSGSALTIWSVAKSLGEAGKKLARNNETWPDKSSEGKTITVGKKKRGERGITPTARYVLQGDKLKMTGTIYYDGDWR